MNGQSIVIMLLVAVVVYLLYKVNQLERLIRDDTRYRRKSSGSNRDPKVVPILKDHIEPGPFRARNQNHTDPPKDS